MSESKRLQAWQKFQIESDIEINLRTMLNLHNNEEFPEALWVVMGIHKALEKCFPSPALSFRDLATMIVESATMLVSLKKNGKFAPGELVKVKLAGKMGHYWSPAPLGMHLVNCYGDLFMVTEEGLESAPEKESSPFESEKLSKKKELATASA